MKQLLIFKDMGPNHSESILSENYSTVNKFLNEVDAACVYAKCKYKIHRWRTFGLNAEVEFLQITSLKRTYGKPWLTTFKYKIYGQGQN